MTTATLDRMLGRPARPARAAVRTAGRHRPSRAAAMLDKIRESARTLRVTTRRYGLALGAAGSFAAAGWTVNATLGCLAMVLSFVYMEWRAAS